MNRRIPQAIEAEEAILGAVLLDATSLDYLSGMEPRHCYKECNGNLLRLMMDWHADRKPIDPMLLHDYMTASGAGDNYGGFLHVSSLGDKAAIPTSVGHYARKVIDAAYRRAVLADLSGVVEALHDPDAAVSDTLAAMESRTRELSDYGTSGAEWTDSVTLASQSYSELAQRVEARRAGRRIGLTTGIDCLDELSGGLRNEKLIVVLGRPGMGKTSFALGIALANAMEGHSVGFISREMTGTELTDRFVSMLSGVNGIAIRDGDIRDDPEHYGNYRRSADDKWRAIEEAYTYFGELKIYVAERAKTISEIRAASLRLQARHGIDLLLVDYLQRVKGEGDNAVERVGSVAMGCKSIARDDLHIPVVLLSQLNRAADGMSSPSAATAKGSGDIEQEADVMLFPIRDSVVDPEASTDAASVIVEKNRGGNTGKVICGWDGPRTRYYDPATKRKPTGGLL